MIIDEQILDLATQYAEQVEWDIATGLHPTCFTAHQDSILKFARELIALAQQEPAHDEVPMPQNADQAQLMALVAENWLKHNAPDRLKEPAQAVPVAWHVPPMTRMYFGEYAQIDAESEAKRVGGTAKAIPLYTHPAPLDSDTRKMVLELCNAVYEHIAVWKYPYGKLTLELAKQIREKLEAGNGE